MPQQTFNLSELRHGNETTAVYQWPQPAQQRGVVVLVHGLSEHAGRYGHVAQALTQAGWQVWGYDHYGHGRSSGRRGDLPEKNHLLDLLGRVIDHIRQHPCTRPDHPLVLVGHSLGGLVVARAAALDLRPVDAVVMSSPALKVEATWFEQVLLKCLIHWLAHFRVNGGQRRHWVSRDRQVVEAFLNDPFAHHKISVLLGTWIMEASEQARRQAPFWHTPALLMYAGADRIVLPEGSRDFALQTPPDCLQSHCFEAMYHEIFNDTERQLPIQMMVQWLQDRFAVRPA